MRTKFNLDTTGAAAKRRAVTSSSSAEVDKPSERAQLGDQAQPQSVVHSPSQKVAPVAATKHRLPKADKMSASNPTRAFDPRTDLTGEETKLVRKFVEKGKAIDKPVRQFLDLGIKVKAIFASKTRRVPVVFEGKSYLAFDDFVEGNFPISGRTLRRWLAKESKTDTRFANKPKANPQPESAVPGNPEQPQTATATATISDLVAERQTRIRSALGIPLIEPVPEIAVRAYEAGWRDGHLDTLADAEKRRGRA
jgi:hypothetical protein